MLMKTPRSLVYLSADELGISERERAGLIEVRDDLASGRVKHAAEFRSKEVKDPSATGFNMTYWYGETDCGTCHCIGGFMWARGAFERAWYVNGKVGDSSLALNSLFYATLVDKDSDDLTPAEAVRAIDHFLAGAGRECWPLALADEPA